LSFWWAKMCSIAARIADRLRLARAIWAGSGRPRGFFRWILLGIMYAGAPYTAIRRAMHINPSVTELIPTMLDGLQPLT
jgi:hypothetical protein